VPGRKVQRDSRHQAAEKILNEEHSGSISQGTILEFLAVPPLVKNPKGRFCASLGLQAWARLPGDVHRPCDGAQFLRVSLGGSEMEAEIRGHRRTYIGRACPPSHPDDEEGRPVNPIFVLDDVDKMSTDFRAIVSALMEVPDPELNQLVTTIPGRRYDLRKSCSFAPPTCCNDSAALQTHGNPAAAHTHRGDCQAVPGEAPRGPEANRAY